MEGVRMTDVLSCGWTMDDYKVFHELKVKANNFNLEVAEKILRMELAERVERDARAAILSTYMEFDDGSDN